jgi:PTH2 family peptidyl-tRNA hydrolase
MYKQVIVVRSDLKLGKGKIAAQAAHASLSAYKITEKKQREAWEDEGCKKVVVKVKDLAELMNVYDKAKTAKLPASIIHDAGKTQTQPNTITCVGIGPAKDQEIDKITKDLKLL